MKNAFTIILLFIFPALVIGQFEWVKNWTWGVPSLPQFNQIVKTERNDFAMRVDLKDIEYIFAINQFGVQVFEYDTFNPDLNCHVGGLASMPDTSFATTIACSAVADPWGHIGGGVEVISKNWDQQSVGGPFFYDSFIAVADSCLLFYSLNSEYHNVYCWGNSYLYSDIITLNKVNEVAVALNGSLLFATENGLEVRSITGSLDTVYYEHVFDKIKINDQGQLIGIRKDTIALFSPEFQLISNNIVPEKIIDFTVDTNKVAVLTENKHVYLYGDTLQLRSDFQINEESDFRFILFSDTTLALAGLERYGLPDDYKGNSSPFVKEYSLEGMTTDFGQDAAVINLEYEMVTSMANVGNIVLHKIHFKDLKVTVLNNGSQPIEKINLRTIFHPINGNMNGSPQDKTRLFSNLSLMPNETMVLSWSDLYAYFEQNPAGNPIEFCIWTSNPNDHLDANSTNDILCQSELVNGEETFSEKTFRVFPNPASDYLIVQKLGSGFQKNASLVMTNITGELIGKMDMENSSEIFWPLGQVPNGVYFVRLVEGEVEWGVQRFIILR